MDRERPATPPIGPTLLTWFLPGAGHALMGSWRTAVAGLVVVEGLYVLGYLLSGGLVFEYLDFELRGRFALVLTPEAGNVGALLGHLMASPLRPMGSAPPPPGSLVHLGAALTAASGVLNLVLMMHAHTLARLGGSGLVHADRAARNVALGWFVPGLGHLVQGRTRRGVIAFVAIVGLFVVGTVLADGSNLTRESGFYYWSGQFLVGVPAVLGELFGGRPPMEALPRFVDAGVFYGCLAGLLNAMLLIDVYAWDESTALGRDPVEDRRAMARARRERKSKKRSGDRAPKTSPASKHLVAPAAPERTEAH